MKTLAIDTSTKAQSLSLTDGLTVFARRITVVRTNHSESLLLNIESMMEQVGWKLTDLELVAVGLGPGTFTGLRVGLATAKAVARSADVPLTGVSSLAATARPVSGLFEGEVFAICDARRGEVYAASYAVDSARFEEISAAKAMTPAALRERVAATTAAVLLVGNGLRAYPELATWEREDVRVLPPPWDAPSAVSLALLGAAQFERDGAADLAALEPDYVRPSDAEMNLSARQARGEKS